MINGLPLPGQHRRLSSSEAHADLMRLAAMLDRDLHDFLVERSTVVGLLRERP
jgi:hypothetical protein